MYLYETGFDFLWGGVLKLAKYNKSLFKNWQAGL